MCDWVIRPLVVTESELADLEKGPAPEISEDARRILEVSSRPEVRAILDPDPAVANKARIAYLRKMVHVIPD